MAFFVESAESDTVFFDCFATRRFYSTDLKQNFLSQASFLESVGRPTQRATAEQHEMGWRAPRRDPPWKSCEMVQQGGMVAQNKVVSRSRSQSTVV